MSIAEQLDSLSREMGMGLRRGMDRRGLTLAKVTNVTDPEKFNRVKCLPIGSENTERGNRLVLCDGARGWHGAGYFLVPAAG